MKENECRAMSELPQKELAHRSKRSLNLKERAFLAIHSLSNVTMLSFWWAVYCIEKNVYQMTCLLGCSDYDVFFENDEGSRVYRCKKLF